MAKNYENQNKTGNYSADKTTSRNAVDSQNCGKNSSANSSKNTSRNKASSAYNREQDEYSDKKQYKTEFQATLFLSESRRQASRNCEACFHIKRRWLQEQNSYI